MAVRVRAGSVAVRAGAPPGSRAGTQEPTALACGVRRRRSAVSRKGVASGGGGACGDPG